MCGGEVLPHLSAATTRFRCVNASEWIALSSLLVALATAVGSVIGYHRNRRDAQEAETKAERATVAAERGANALERSARAVELRQQRALSERPNGKGVAWQLRWAEGDSYLLENVGTASAYDVTVEPIDTEMGFEGPAPGMGVDVRPHEDLRFLAALTLDVVDDRLLVAWQDHPEADDRHTWRRSLPPRR